MRNFFYGLLIIGLAGAGGFAQTELDAAFGRDGVQTVSFGFNATGGDVAIQPDQKIVVAGACTPSSDQQCVARYNEDGSLDTTFAQQGFQMNPGAHSGSLLALQNDGKIVVGGTNTLVTPPGYTVRITLTRYNTDGTLDSSFSGGNRIFGAGYGLASPRAMVILPDGKIMIAGESNLWTQFPTPNNQGWIARYLSDGTPDTSFGSNGIMNVPGDGVVPQSGCSSIALQPDGKLLLGIRQQYGAGPYMLQRWNPDGTLDPTWGGGDGIVDIGPVGQTQVDSIKNLQVMPDGRVVGILGQAIARLNPDGSLDATFAGDGIRELTSGFGLPFRMAVSASGRITMTGNAPGFPFKFAIYKFKADGSNETGFGNNGLLEIDPLGTGGNSNSTSCKLDAQNRLVAVGNATGSPNRFVVLRLAAPPIMSASVSGRVTDANGNGVANATVSTQGVSTQTSPFGYYYLGNIPTNRTYIFSVRSRGGAAFTKRTILVDDYLTGIDFVGQQLDHSRTIQLNEAAPKSLGPSIRKLR